MAGRRAGSDEAAAGAPSLARRVPSQRRSRERLERILDAAAALMAEKGSEAFRMRDLVERTGIGFGSLYQYFPDKTAIIGTLAERCNTRGRDCVRRDLALVAGAADLHPALCRIVDGYYRMFTDEPAMRAIWQATQADRALQQLDAADGAYLAGLLAASLRRIAPASDPAALDALAQLTMTLIAAAVRHAITLPPAEARRVLALFKGMLPKEVGVAGA